MTFKQYASSSAGNLYTVQSQTTKIMIEAGLSIASIKKHLDFSLSGISGCLVTHEHQDHAKACKEIMKAGVELYTSAGTAAALGLSGHRLNIVTAGNQFRVGCFTVLPFAVEHDCKEPLGFLITDGIDKLMFATDTHYIKYRFKGLTMVAVECNHSLELITELEPARRKRLMETHMSLETCLELLKANDMSRVKEIHLLHLSAGNSDAPLFQRTVEDETGIPVYIL
ncbi:MAG: MBL fold metallo-hydrolase [Deferribacterales bacterium]